MINMLESYLFIPANKMSMIQKSQTFENLDYRILDLEDSIAGDDLETALNNLKEDKMQNTDWV